MWKKEQDWKVERKRNEKRKEVRGGGKVR